jgi:hypothetical protein
VLLKPAGKVFTSIIVAASHTSEFHATRMDLTERVTQATLFMATFAAFLGCWSDVHIHGHVRYDGYRHSKAPWVIFYVASCFSFLSGATTVLVNSSVYLPSLRTLEIWTTIMGVIMVLGSFVLALIMWRKFLPEDSRAKQISLNIQTTGLLFVCICFILRQRMVWIPTSYLGITAYQQLTKFVYLASEWLAIGVMLIFTFPRSSQGSSYVPNSEVIRMQWKRTKLVSGLAALFAFLATIASILALVLAEPHKGDFYSLFRAFDIAVILMNMFGFLICAFICWACWLKKFRTFLRIMVIFLIVLASMSGGYCFSLIMSMIISVQPFHNPSAALIIGTIATTVVTIGMSILCSFSYRLSNYIKDPNTIDLFVDFFVIEGDLEHYEQPNKELEDKAATIRRFLLASLFLHTLWICVYFIPATNRSLASKFTWGWLVPLFSVIFVMARLPLALFGYVSTLVYRRDSNRLRGYVIAQAALNVLGLAVMALQAVFWICDQDRCSSTAVTIPFTPQQKVLFVLSAILLMLLIFEFLVNYLYYSWFKKVRSRLSSLILEDINHKVDAMFQ